MKILTGYVIRAHVGPFFFAFTAVTGLLFLNAVAQRLESLAGKGLELSVIGEFMLLSLPHIVALTFPMAILVAVLYAFSDLTSQNEIAAMAAGGIHPLRLMVPLVGVGIILSLTMFAFNDRVLPESNHRLSSLLGDIGSKSPTFELREQVINEVVTGDNTRYFLKARTIDPVSSVLQDVTIYDLSRASQNRTIVSERGTMAFTPDGRDLYLTLEDGLVYETADDRPGAFQRLAFDTQILPLRGVGTELERRAGSGSRSNREMNITMLQGRVEEHLESVARVADESRRVSVETVQEALGGPAATEAEALVDRDELEAELGDEMEEELEEHLFIPEAAGIVSDHVIENVASFHRINQTRWDVHAQSTFSYRVEIHKKYAIAFACLIFVLLGPPLALRFPQGGVGMVIAASVGIFFFYWAGLIGGERLADRGQMNPALAMWLPNIVLLIPTIFLIKGMGRKISTSRTGSWDEVLFRIGHALRNPFRREAGAEASGSAKA